MITDPTYKRIIDNSMHKFFTFGFSRVTMGEIASGSKISKKTLYKYFNNKLDLFECVMNKFLEEISENIDLILKEEVPYTDKFKLFLDLIGHQVERLSSNSIKDIKDNAPEAWSLVVFVREKGIETNFVKLIDEGKQKGLINCTYDDKFILDIFLGALERLTGSERMANSSISMKEVIQSLTSILMQGILKTLEE